MANTWDMIEKRITVLGPLYKQMDKTADRLNGKPFTLTDFDGKTAIRDSISVTENKSANFVTRIIAGLMNSRWQTVIEGDITSRESHKLEQFIEDNLEQTDEYILNQWGIAGLATWISSHVCSRGFIGVEWLLNIVGDQYQIHCLPVDMRYTPYVLNKWVAPITFRTKDDLEQELERYAEIKGGTFKEPPKLKDTDNEVRDFWGTDTNELWINGNPVFTQKNPFGKPPFVIVSPPTGFMLRDKGWIENESPSLLFLNEGLYDQISRHLSVDATLGFEPLAPAYEYEVENPDGQPSRPTPDRGDSQAVPIGELHKLVPRGDLNLAARTSNAEILQLVDEAAPISPRAYTSPPSALEVTTEVELLNQLQAPRILALQMFKEQLIRMMIEQFVLVGENVQGVDIGKTGKKRSYSVTQLKDPQKYSVTCKLMTKNKRIEIVNEARALALWGRAPTKQILEDVLMVEDPDGWIRELELQKAKEADPALALFEMAIRYAEEAEDINDPNYAEMKKFESMMLADRGIAIVKERMNPAPLPQDAQTPQVKGETGNSQGLISLLGQRTSA